MGSDNNIKKIGIAEELPDNPQFFKQLAIEETVTIPETKPNIEKLISIMVEPEILAIKPIDTPCIKSFEGQLLSGKKLVIELKLKQKITYIADDEEQTVHAAHFEKIIRSIFIVVPQRIDNSSIERLIKLDKVKVVPYIEHVFAQLQSKRDIFKNIILFIDVVFLN